MTHPGFAFQIRIEGAHVETPGVDFSARVRLIHRSGRYAVLHVPAGSHWSGLGSRSAHGSSWMLVKVERRSRTAKESLNGKAWSADFAVVVEEERPGAKWRATRARMVQLCKLATCPCGGIIVNGAFVHAETCARPW